MKGHWHFPQPSSLPGERIDRLTFPLSSSRVIKMTDVTAKLTCIFFSSHFEWQQIACMLFVHFTQGYCMNSAIINIKMRKK